PPARPGPRPPRSASGPSAASRANGTARGRRSSLGRCPRAVTTPAGTTATRRLALGRPGYGSGVEREPEHEEQAPRRSVTTQVDDEFRSLMEGLRTTLPGIQIITAFLLTLPLYDRFDDF